MKLCIFEDEKYRRLLPLVWTRPVYELRCGITALAEKTVSLFDGFDTVFHCRDYLAETFSESSGAVVNRFERDDYLLVNGRIRAGAEFVRQIDLDGGPCLYRAGDTVAAAVIPRDESGGLAGIAGTAFDPAELYPSYPVRDVDVPVIDYPWDLVEQNAEAIRADLDMIPHKEFGKHGGCDEAHYINEKDVYIASGVSIKPGSVIDAEAGPVIIDRDARIAPLAVICGPAYIGRNTQVNAGAKILPGTTVGPVCKVGGEISNSILHGYCNKQHDGYLGAAYLGEWVNLGAGTNNSDLKNNYSTVRITIDGSEIDTGLVHAGLFMGDHSKTGIGTQLNTGTVAGVHCNIFGHGFPGKNIPSFSWGGAAKMVEFRLEKALETAAAAMARRNVELSDAVRGLYSQIFRLTAKDREGERTE